LRIVPVRDRLRGVHSMGDASMRAVVLSVSREEIRERRARGADRWDELWEGELHMVPPPGWHHQSLVGDLTVFLAAECARRSLGRIVPQAGLSDPRNPKGNYRVPDLVFVARGRERNIRPQGAVGAVDLVIEVRSQGDESYEKLEFYARVGVGEVLILDAQTHRPELFRLVGREYVAVAADAQGWITSDALRIRLRRSERSRKLRIEVVGAPRRGIEL
jgi:Uma2 family endonuclease